VLEHPTAGMVQVIQGTIATLLRPWFMLPSGRTLASLGDDPWADLERGGPLFPD
jgi:hypothetical protein